MWRSLLVRLSGSNVSPALLSSYLTMLTEVKRVLLREDVCCRRCSDLFFSLLQTIFGTKQLTLVGREERAILAKTCSNMLIAEVCENEIFLIGGYNKKNLNVVGVSASLVTVTHSISNFPELSLDKWKQILRFKSQGFLIPGKHCQVIFSYPALSVFYLDAVG